jgi:hypothetical protein
LGTARYCGTPSTALSKGRLEVQRVHYFNYLLFASTWFARQLIKILGIKEANENEFNSAALNLLLLWTFALDVRAAPVIHPGIDPGN